MKIIYGHLFFVTVVLISCTNKTPKLVNERIFDAKTEIRKTNDFLKQYEVPSQFFIVSSDNSSQVKGKQGTIISVNPKNLETYNGRPIGKNIEIELKELTNQEQLLRTNAQTTSNGKLLVSGGAYYINMTSDGQQLNLKTGKSLSVVFPKIASNEMTLFYGEKDTLGQLNWLPTDQKLERKPNKRTNVVNDLRTDSINKIDDIFGYIDSEANTPPTPEEQRIEEEQKKNEALNDKVYKAIELKQFGWINCDRFYEVPNKTNLQFSFRQSDSIVSANVYLVFKDINSVMQCSYFSFNNNEYNRRFEDIPVGSKIQLIVFSIKNGKTYTHKSDLTIKPNQTVQLTLKETSQDKIGELFQSNL